MKLGHFLKSKLDRNDIAPYKSSKDENVPASVEVRQLQLRGRAIPIFYDSDSKKNKSIFKKNQVQPLPHSSVSEQQQNQPPELSVPVAAFRAVKKSITSKFTRSTDDKTQKSADKKEKTEKVIKRSVLTIRGEAPAPAANNNVAANHSKESLQKQLIAQIPAFSRRVGAQQKNLIQPAVISAPKVIENKYTQNEPFRSRITHQLNPKYKISPTPCLQPLNLTTHNRKIVNLQQKIIVPVPSSEVLKPTNNKFQRNNNAIPQPKSDVSSTIQITRSSKIIHNPISSPCIAKPCIVDESVSPKLSTKKSRNSRGKPRGIECRKRLLKIACLNTMKNRIMTEGRKSFIDFGKVLKNEFKFLKKII